MIYADSSRDGRLHRTFGAGEVSGSILTSASILLIDLKKWVEQKQQQKKCQKRINHFSCQLQLSSTEYQIPDVQRLIHRFNQCEVEEGVFVEGECVHFCKKKR